jgi:ribosomal protein S18 acetylase RimI-like enzyme
VDTTLSRPQPSELRALADTLAAWQQDDGVVHLHPGDLGWYSMRGAPATAGALRTWSRGGRIVAVGLLDGPDGLLRLAVDPTLRRDEPLAVHIAADIADPAGAVLPAGAVVVEARGAEALQAVLVGAGWGLDEPWTPLRRDLSGPVDDVLVDRAGVSVEEVGLDRAAAWMEVHWSAFKGTPFGEAEERTGVDWWSTMMSGPFAERGRSLALLDPAGDAVAVVGVWSAGPGRPGLIEPMGVRGDHRGRGYGAAVCEAATSVLRAMGATSAVVCAESSNVGAIATYTAAGFEACPEVADLIRLA